jgi:phosphoenolpyruvate synthase/pyruvate phosphate dikinase
MSPVATNQMQVLRFDQLGRDDVHLGGGKGASLGELSAIGVRVPAGYVVTTHAFGEALAAVDSDGAMAAAIERLDGDDLDAVRGATARMRDGFERAPLPDRLRNEIGRMYDELCCSAVQEWLPVAVRSSATCEDSAEASFAGLQDTYLWIRGENAVIDAVRRCWASLYTVDSVAYRRRRSLPEDGCAMAVVVQRMVDARSSGVMFTRSPLNGDRSVVAVEASWGLGSAVVGGAVTPDAFTVNKVTGDVIRRTIADKRVRDVPAEDGTGVRAEPVPDELRTVPAVNDAELRCLVELARRVEDHYGCPQDLEWAISASAPEGENVFLLQSRPETVWTGRAGAPTASPKGRAFDHVLALLGGGGAGMPGEDGKPC